MIIKISQTASNIKQTYSIDCDRFHFQGNCGKFHHLQEITLSNQTNSLTGIYQPSKWVNYIPFCYLFGMQSLTRTFLLHKNDHSYGTVTLATLGFFKSHYVIALDNGEILRCYNLSKGSFDYVSVYLGDQQIALLETYLNVNDYKYTHKLYLLDEYDRFAETLSFFSLYYATYRFAKRFHMSKVSVYEKSWSYSVYNGKYDESWREKHFPNEDFFGKIHLFDS